MSATREAILELKARIGKLVLGQDHLVESMLIGLLANGNILLESLPGLAKTRAVKALAKNLAADLSRIQFTPDLLPSDVTGAEIYVQTDKGGQFTFQRGPIFANLLLADEINRAPAKVQAALLEAMAERQVTVGGVTYALPKLFLVMATQNPIEQEGTYPLPEAQLDRFLLHVKIDYPNLEAERRILRLVRGEANGETVGFGEPLSQSTIFAARRAALSTYMSDAVEEYLLQFVFATRNPTLYGDDLEGLVSFGASPRGSIALDRCARAYAWLRGRDFVTPEDVQAVAKPVLRHRVLMTFEAEADGMGTDDFLDALIARVPVS